MTIKTPTTTLPTPRITIKMDSSPIPTKMSTNSQNKTHSNKNATSPIMSKITTKKKTLIKNIPLKSNKKSIANLNPNLSPINPNPNPNRKASNK